MFSLTEVLTSLALLFTAAALYTLSPIVKEHIPAAVRNYLVSIYEKYSFTPRLTEVLTSLAPLFTAAALYTLSPIVKEHIPAAIRNYLVSIYEKYSFKPQLTLTIEPNCDLGSNEIHEAAKVYLPTKISDSSRYLKVSKSSRQEEPVLDIVEGEVIIDDFEGIKLKWKISTTKRDDELERLGFRSGGKKVFNITFDKRFKNAVIGSYLSHVLDFYKKTLKDKKVVNLHCCGRGGSESNSIILEHPATFDKLAMDPMLKMKVKNDLDRFVARKELYKRAGKPWKRGYLIHGPPGTGKSSMIAAMANHLKFDIYDLKFSEIHSDSDLRKILISTPNRSIIAIEDIDCGTVSDKPVQGDKVLNQIPSPKLEFTLSGLLNFIDGLWSSCGDERIIVFTTNHKERLNNLDPALFRPGRVDMEVPMTYITMEGFKLLASNYHYIKDHGLFEKIEGFLKNNNVTPAEIAEELLKSDDHDEILEGLVKFLEKKETQKEKETAKEKETEKTEKKETEKEKETTEKEI